MTMNDFFFFGSEMETGVCSINVALFRKLHSAYKLQIVINCWRSNEPKCARKI